MPVKRLNKIINDPKPYMPGWNFDTGALGASRVPLEYDDGWLQVPANAKYRLKAWAVIGAKPIEITTENPLSYAHAHLGLGVLGARRDMVSDTATVNWNYGEPLDEKWESVPGEGRSIAGRPDSVYVRAARVYQSSNVEILQVLWIVQVEAEW